ncbi:MAG: hypothetical protein AAGJ35_04300, partial [Myxococcota bacterium]
TQRIFRPTRLLLRAFSLHRPSGTIAYVQGSGDRIPQALSAVGIPVTLLSDVQLRSAKLSAFSTIILGIRAFNTRSVLREHNQRLWKYVREGGRLIVQYNVHRRWRPLTTPVAPLPLEIGIQRVTQEQAPVTILRPQHPIFQTPHALSKRDFQDWVQERGLYFAKRWHPQFRSMLGMNDPNESPTRGSLLLAHIGKGVYLYTGMSFFRQLPAGVPGAFRLFVNLLSTPTHAAQKHLPTQRAASKNTQRSPKKTQHLSKKIQATLEKVPASSKKVQAPPKKSPSISKAARPATPTTQSHESAASQPRSPKNKR